MSAPEYEDRRQISEEFLSSPLRNLLPNIDRVETIIDHGTHDQQILDQPLLGVSCQQIYDITIPLRVVDHHNNASSQHPSNPIRSHLPEVTRARLLHRDVEKSLSATEDVPSASIPPSTSNQVAESKVLCQELTIHNYKHKFCQLLRSEELTHAKMLKNR